MAVIEGVPSLKVEVCVNDQSLKEYDNDENVDDLSSVTKYIEAIIGAKFTTRWMFDSRFVPRHGIMVTLNVDGQKASRGCYNIEKLKNRINRWSSITGARERVDGKRYIRDIVFTVFSTDDSGDGIAAGDALFQRLKHVGVITLKFQWIDIKGVIPSHDYVAPSLNEFTGKIPEKALKGRALSNQVTMGDRRLLPGNTSVDCKTIGDPFAVYNFKYRSKKDLQSLLIIPRDVSSPLRVQEGAESIGERGDNQGEHNADVEANTRGTQHVKVENRKINCNRTVKTEHIKRERDLTELDLAATTDGEVTFVSASKRRRLAVTVDEKGVETIDLT